MDRRKLEMMMKRYALVCVLAPLPEGSDGIPESWLGDLPESALVSADKLKAPNGQEAQNLLADIGFEMRTHAFSFERAIKRDGWPG